MNQTKYRGIPTLFNRTLNLFQRIDVQCIVDNKHM